MGFFLSLPPLLEPLLYFLESLRLKLWFETLYEELLSELELEEEELLSEEDEEDDEGDLLLLFLLVDFILIYLYS